MLTFIANWVWPRDRCRSGSSLSWHPDYIQSGSPSKSLARISRAADGRFVLVDSAFSSRGNSPSNFSSSDDGGFLNRKDLRNRASWRKPLIGYPSQLSLRSDASGQSARPTIPIFPGTFGGPRFHYPVRPIPTIYSPVTPFFQSSSPTDSTAFLLTSPWSPMYFSDLSSVRYPSSAERSFPTPPGFMQLRSVHERYSQELPSLSAIHEESRSFIPVHPIQDSPVSRIHFPPPYPAHPGPRSRARLLPRHARITRSAPELGSPDHFDRSPESRSSSSGFGSKNTSQQNQSSQSGSIFTEWKLPPYRPPPPPPSALPPPPPLVGHWLELASSSPSTSEQLHKAVDVGSVDGHYEFDHTTPTPTPSTPTERRDGDLDSAPVRKSYGTLRSTRYDNIEARVQAMKEEFNEFRKRQAKRKQSHELESAC